MTHSVYMYYAIHMQRKMFCENSLNRLCGPNSLVLNPVDYAVYEGLFSRVCIALRFPTWTISKTKVRTCWENLDQQIIDESIDHWRDKL